MKRKFRIIFIVFFIYSTLCAEKFYKEYPDGSGKWLYFTEFWYEYDSNNNLLHKKSSSYNEETFYQYDANNNLIYEKDKSIFGTFEKWYSNNILIHEKDFDGTEVLYNSKGQEIYRRFHDGDECWTEYDSNGNPYHETYSTGEEEWSEFNSNNNKIYSIYSSDDDKIEYWYEYDTSDNIIYEKTKHKDGSIKEIWHGYDIQGKEISYKDSAGIAWEYFYDEYGNKVKYVSSDSDSSYSREYNFKYEYDEQGKLQHLIALTDGYEIWYDSHGNELHKINFEQYENESTEAFEYWFEYDENNNVKKFQNSKGITISYEYNFNKLIHVKTNNVWFKIENSRPTYFNDSNEYEKWIEYNSDGKRIHSKDSNNIESWYKYDSAGNEIYYKDSNENERKYNSNGKLIYEKEVYIDENEYEKNETNLLDFNLLRNLY